MAKWYTISAKFTSEEKRILDILRDVYGLSHNQSLRGGVEFLARILAMSEYYVMSDSKIMKKRDKIKHEIEKDEEREEKFIQKYGPISEWSKEVQEMYDDSEYDDTSLT